MILNYDQLGELYFYPYKDNLNIDLSKNNYAENIYDTAKYLIDAVDDELLITNEGRCMIYVMDSLLDKIYKNKDSSIFSELTKMIPEEFKTQIKSINTRINKQLIDYKINPSDLFYRSTGRGVY